MCVTLQVSEIAAREDDNTRHKRPHVRIYVTHLGPIVPIASALALCERVLEPPPKFVTALCFVYRCFTSRRSPVVVYFVVFELVGGERGECRRCLGGFLVDEIIRRDKSNIGW